MNIEVNETRVPFGSCPMCFKQLDACTSTPNNPGDKPTPGSYSICIYCGSVLMFTENMTLRHVPNAELMLLTSEERAYLRAVQRAVREEVPKP